jgi:hypothetical protein
MTKLILLTIILIVVAPAQAQETYRLPPGQMPITYLSELNVGDTSRQLSESERRGLVRLLVESHVVSVRKYNQSYPLPIDVPVYKLLKTNFPDIAKHEGEGVVMLSTITEFVYRIPEYKPIVDQVLREGLTKAKRCSK